MCVMYSLAPLTSIPIWVAYLSGLVPDAMGHCRCRRHRRMSLATGAAEPHPAPSNPACADRSEGYKRVCISTCDLAKANRKHGLYSIDKQNYPKQRTSSKCMCA